MGYDTHVNFGYGTVMTPPTPATSGVTIVLQSGQGALFPATPFNATLWPGGSGPFSANAEVVRVTLIAGDTLTVVRAQEGTAAKTIVAGFQITDALTAQKLRDVENFIKLPNIVVDGDSQSMDTSVYIGVANSEWHYVLRQKLYWRNYSNYYNSAVAGNAAYQRDTAYAAGAGTKKPGPSFADNAYYFIYAGINDIRADITGAATYASLFSLWSKARADGFCVIAFTVPIWADGSYSSGRNTERLALNTLIRAAGAFYDYLIDLDSLFNATNLVGDNIHLNAAAHQVIADTIYAAVSSKHHSRLPITGGTIGGKLTVIVPPGIDMDVFELSSNDRTGGFLFQVPRFSSPQIKTRAGAIQLQPQSVGVGIFKGTLNPEAELDVFGSICMTGSNRGLQLKGAGSRIEIAEGVNCCMGTAVLNGTTAVVINTSRVGANTRIFLTIQAPGGTVGSAYVSARVAATSFSIKSTNAADTSTVAWVMMEPS